MSAPANPPTLSAAEAYRLWAPTYDAESALTAIEDIGVRTHAPAPSVRTRLLDAGCGTARRLAGATPDGAALRVGIDLVPEMLAEARRRHHEPFHLAAADVCALPFGDASFDTVWCRLALGHVQDLDGAYRDLARVARDRATVVVTDFHPRAAAAGFARTFRDACGTLRAVHHVRHEPSQHVRAARAAGLELRAREDLAVGPAAQPHYEAAGRGHQYREQYGSPMVLLLRFERRAGI